MSIINTFLPVTTFVRLNLLNTRLTDRYFLDIEFNTYTHTPPHTHTYKWRCTVPYRQYSVPHIVLVITWPSNPRETYFGSNS